MRAMMGSTSRKRRSTLRFAFEQSARQLGAGGGVASSSWPPVPRLSRCVRYAGGDQARLERAHFQRTEDGRHDLYIGLGAQITASQALCRAGTDGSSTALRGLCPGGSSASVRSRPIDASSIAWRRRASSATAGCARNLCQVTCNRGRWRRPQPHWFSDDRTRLGGTVAWSPAARPAPDLGRSRHAHGGMQSWISSANAAQVRIRKHCLPEAG